MQKIKANKKALKHILCCIVLLLIFVLTFTKVYAKEKGDYKVFDQEESSIPLSRLLENKSLIKIKGLNKKEINYIKYNKPRIIEKNIKYYINLKIDTLTFFSNMFGYNIEFIKKDLIKRSNNKYFEPTNIGSIKDNNNNIIKYESIDYGISEYFFDLINRDKENRNIKITPYNGDSEYIEKLIIYFTSIYTDVDTTLALSIGSIESGGYKVKYMLNKNNIYGGMGSKGLIEHENIELGVLKYIRLLSNGYIKKGLNTLEEIGKRYCPTINEYGQKIASPNWINSVNNAKEKYKNYTQNIMIKDLI